MPSERSLYRKIQEVLETSKAVHVESIEDLRDKLLKRRDKMFKTLQYNPEKDLMSLLPSSRVIKSTVRMCYLLGLISQTGELTEVGRQALQRKRYDKIIENQARKFLIEQNMDLDQMNQVITESLQAKPVVLPTSTVLWQATGGKISKGLFTKLLTLMCHVGGADSSQRKIFLHIAIK